MDTTLNRLAAIVGPTASGKTGLGVALRALGLPIEAINCDASQLVRGLDAATAKPTAEELAALPHHLIDSVSPTESVDAAAFAEMADGAVEKVVAGGGWPVLIGGTGLYHRAVVRGLAPLPPSSAELRQQLEEQAQQLGMAEMHRRLASVDPAYAEKTPANNRQRVLRALEVYELSGRSFSDFHAEHRGEPDRYRCLNVVIEPDLAVHRERLTRRAEAMVEPLLREVEALLASGLAPEAPGMQALGYREAAAQIIAGDVDPEGLRQHLIRAHRRYAKRQRTWFRKLDNALRVTTPEPSPALVELLRRWFDAGSVSR